MKYLALLLVASMFVAMGAAQPEESPDIEPDLDENATNQSDEELDVNESEEVEANESEEDEANESEEDRESQGESAQFDARLQTAITTLDDLKEIAPNDEAQSGIEEALTTLRGVQSSTDSASLGPEEDSEENETGQRGPSEDAGPEGDRGPSDNGNRPGFVQGLVGGIFG